MSIDINGGMHDSLGRFDGHLQVEVDTTEVLTVVNPDVLTADMADGITTWLVERSAAAKAAGVTMADDAELADSNVAAGDLMTRIATARGIDGLATEHRNRVNRKISEWVATRNTVEDDDAQAASDEDAADLVYRLAVDNSIEQNLHAAGKITSAHLDAEGPAPIPAKPATTEIFDSVMTTYTEMKAAAKAASTKKGRDYRNARADGILHALQMIAAAK